jgi:hypothetical protein
MFLEILSRCATQLYFILFYFFDANVQLNFGVYSCIYYLILYRYTVEVDNYESIRIIHTQRCVPVHVQIRCVMNNLS